MKNLGEEIARLSEELEEDFDFQGVFLGYDIITTRRPAY